MKKVVYSVQKLGKFDNPKLTGVGCIADNSLIMLLLFSIRILASISFCFASNSFKRLAVVSVITPCSMALRIFSVALSTYFFSCIKSGITQILTICFSCTFKRFFIMLSKISGFDSSLIIVEITISSICSFLTVAF